MEHAISVSIIGSASAKGVLSNEKLLTQKTWEVLCSTTEQHINNQISHDWSKIHLVSGGAAWCDHIAVFLYLKHPESKLTLHFPCKWDTNKKQFIDNGLYHWAKNPGRTANSYHLSFQKKIKENTLEQIHDAIGQGAIVCDHYKGFHDRNLIVGQSQHLIAFSFSTGDIPSDGGTLHTWKQSKSAHKTYYSISSLCQEI